MHKNGGKYSQHWGRYNQRIQRTSLNLGSAGGVGGGGVVAGKEAQQDFRTRGK